MLCPMYNERVFTKELSSQIVAFEFFKNYILTNTSFRQFFYIVLARNRRGVYPMRQLSHETVFVDARVV